MSDRRILFFTGGTAIRELSREFAKINPDTIHLVTTFDSGGSTAILRKTFAIPAVGDIRNRLLALADRDKAGEETIALCNKRIAKDITKEDALAEIKSYADPAALAWKGIPQDIAAGLLQCLRYFFKRMPADFDARGASLGNLMIAGAYLEYNRDFNPVLGKFNNLLHTRGTVLPIVNASLHLGASLKDGNVIVGQHLFEHLSSPVARIFLTVHEACAKIAPHVHPVECFPAILPEAASYIHSANVICYPMGSFYSSVLANLVPRGVGRSIAQSRAIKIFIPNSGGDHELGTVPVPEQARIILRRLREDAPYADNEDLMHIVLVDTRHGQYPGGWDAAMEKELRHLGLRVVDRDMVLEDNPGRHAPLVVARVLEDIAARKFHV